MNKELIKKYKAEFDHWLNGGEVLFFYWEDWYSSTCNPEMIFNHISPDDVKYYIINDEFVEIRKALAEGKSIQMLCKYDKMEPIWDDMTEVIKSIGFVDVKENYRIKPEAPKFKVGDWVRNRINEIGQILQEDYKSKGLYKISNTHALKCEVGTSAKDLTIWVPKKGDWCWFWNKNGIPTIGQFLSIETDGNRKYSATFPNTPHPFITYYDYCEPFLGQLPTNIQEAL